MKKPWKNHFRLADLLIEKKRRRKLFVTLSMLVVFCVCYSLMLPAVTITVSTFCGREEHCHSQACYLSEIPLCENDEHEHCENCYQSQTPLCQKEEHTHSKQCESNPQAVDSIQDIEESLPNELDEDINQAILQIAQSQKDYEESSKNFLVNDDGSLNGYTRYGDWAKDAYGDWNVYFTGFVLDRANISLEDVFYNEDLSKWLADAKAELKSDTSKLQPGNIVFFYESEDNLHVGFLENTKEDESGDLILNLICGDEEDRVQAISVNASKLFSFLDIKEMLDEKESLAKAQEENNTVQEEQQAYIEPERLHPVYSQTDIDDEHQDGQENSLSLSILKGATLEIQNVEENSLIVYSSSDICEDDYSVVQNQTSLFITSKQEGKLTLNITNQEEIFTYNITILPSWKLIFDANIDESVFFEDEGGNSIEWVDVEGYLYGESVPLPKAVCSGYEFLGWSLTKENCTELVNTIDSDSEKKLNLTNTNNEVSLLSNTDEITLYAQWKKIEQVSEPAVINEQEVQTSLTTSDDTSAKQNWQDVQIIKKSDTTAFTDSYSFVSSPLSNAVFKLYKANLVSAENNSYEKGDEAVVDTNYITDENGIADLGYLQEGAYYIQEISAPEGYITPSEDQLILFFVEVDADGNEVVTLADPENKLTSVGSDEAISSNPFYINDTWQIYIYNSPTSTAQHALPNTGSNSCFLFEAGGAILAISAAAVLVIDQQKQHQKRD